MLLQLYSLLHVRYIGWLESVGSRVVYELDYKKPILYVIPIQRQASCGSRRWHRNYPVPPAQHISWRSRRPTTGCWRWMQDVVRQLVGFGMVPGHVMNLKGWKHETTHGERFHVTSMHRHVWAMLSSALHGLYRFRSVLPAVHGGYKLWAEYAAP